MPCVLHHSFCIGSYVMYLRSWLYRYNILDAAPYLIGYAGRRHCITLMHLKYCWKRCHCYFYWKFVHYILFYHWFVTKVLFYIKLLFNWTCGLNSSPKQNLLAEMFHLTLALLNAGTRYLSWGLGSSSTFHISCKDTHLTIASLTLVIKFDVDILKYDVN
jgi:hypothetical protein